MKSSFENVFFCFLRERGFFCSGLKDIKKNILFFYSLRQGIYPTTATNVEKDEKELFEALEIWKIKRQP